MNKLIKLLPIFSILFISTASAEMYRYIDEEGKVIYSQFKPTTAKEFSTIAPPPPPPGSQKVAAEPLPEATEEMSENTDPENAADSEATDEQAQAKAEQEKANLAIKRKNCEAAKSNLKVLESVDPNQRIIGQDGKELKFDDAQRQAKIREAKKVIKASCQ